MPKAPKTAQAARDPRADCGRWPRGRCGAGVSGLPWSPSFSPTCRRISSCHAVEVPSPEYTTPRASCMSRAPGKRMRTSRHWRPCTTSWSASTILSGSWTITCSVGQLGETSRCGGSARQRIARGCLPLHLPTEPTIFNIPRDPKKVTGDAQAAPCPPSVTKPPPPERTSRASAGIT